MLMTVKELAEAAGVSTQAIYKRLRTDLQPFVKDDNGKRMIDSSALDRLSGNRAQQDTEVTNRDALVTNVANDQKHEIELLKLRLKNAEDLLIERDRLIEALREQLAQKDAQIIASDQRLHEAHTVQMTLTATMAAMKPGGLSAWFKKLLPGGKNNDSIDVNS